MAPVLAASLGAWNGHLPLPLPEYRNDVEGCVKSFLLAVAWFAVLAGNSAMAKGAQTLTKDPPLVRTSIRLLARQASPVAVMGATAMPALRGVSAQPMLGARLISWRLLS